MRCDSLGIGAACILHMHVFSEGMASHTLTQRSRRTNTIDDFASPVAFRKKKKTVHVSSRDKGINKGRNARAANKSKAQKRYRLRTTSLVSQKVRKLCGNTHRSRRGRTNGQTIWRIVNILVSRSPRGRRIVTQKRGSQQKGESADCVAYKRLRRRRTRLPAHVDCVLQTNNPRVWQVHTSAYLRKGSALGQRKRGPN